MSDISGFLSYVGDNPDAWREIIGQRIKHSMWDSGTILEVRGESAKDILVLVRFDRRVEPSRGLPEGVKRLAGTAFDGIRVTELTLPANVKEGMARFERAKEEERRQRELRERQLREQMDREASARRQFLELKRRYQVESFEDGSPLSRLNMILVKLDEEARLTPEDEAWLMERRLFPVLAFNSERIGRLASAGSYWRKARRPKRALEITEPDTADPCVLTMRGGAFRDIGQLDAAEESGKRAIALAPEDYHPYNLLGAVCLQSDRLQQGLDYFQQAEELGCPPDRVDQNIRSAVRQASRAEQCEVAKYLFAKDPAKFAWAKHYLKEGAT